MKLIKKKRLMAFALTLALVFSLVPGVKSKAGNIGIVEDNYQFDFKKTGTSSEVVSADTDMENYIGGKKDAFINLLKERNVATTSADIDSLFSYESGDYKYAVIQSVTSGTEYVMIEGVLKAIDKLTIEYTEVTVTLAEQGTAAQKISEINITVDSPEIGSTITETSSPSISLGTGANFTSEGMYINCYPSQGEYDDGAIFGTTIEEGEYYYFEIYLYPKEGYEFDSSDNVSVKVNGGNDFELGYCSEYQFAIFSRVKAVAPAPTVYTVKFETGEGSKVDLQEIESGKTATKPSANPTRTGYTFGGWYADEDWKTEFDFSKAITADTTVYAKWTAEEKKPTYTILDGANQTLETEAGKDLVVRASGEVSKFTGLKIDGKEVEKSNYTITEGSTIATIKAALLDTLDEGEHTLTFVYTDGEVSTSFTMKKHTTPVTVTTTPAEVTTPATTEAAAKKTNAASPKTGDSLPVIPLAVLMITSLAGALLLKKKRTNI